MVIDDGKVPESHLRKYMNAGRNQNISVFFITQDLFDKKEILKRDFQSNFNVFVLGILKREEWSIKQFIQTWSTNHKKDKEDDSTITIQDEIFANVNSILFCSQISRHKFIYIYDYSCLKH